MKFWTHSCFRKNLRAPLSETEDDLVRFTALFHPAGLRPRFFLFPVNFPALFSVMEPAGVKSGGPEQAADRAARVSAEAVMFEAEVLPSL